MGDLNPFNFDDLFAANGTSLAALKEQRLISFAALTLDRLFEANAFYYLLWKPGPLSPMTAKGITTIKDGVNQFRIISGRSAFNNLEIPTAQMASPIKYSYES
jgi:hypothetical protein